MIWVILALFLVPMALGVEVNSSTEIYTFNITDCQANETSVGCPDAWIRFNCSISNYAYIDYVDFEIDSTEYLTNRNLAHFWYDFHKPITTIDTNTDIEFEKVKIYDVSAGIAQYFPSIEVTHICDACDYTISYGDCEITDQMNVTYTGDGSANCTSYNTTETCDYCTPDWEITSDCLINNTEFREYNDLNACFGLTGLASDTCNYWFADCDSWVECSFLEDDLDCGYDTVPLIEVVGNRIFWYCSPTNSSIDYSCISYVKDGEMVVQTNPQQKTFSSGIWGREQETREFFTAQNGLVNPYFTTDNLKHNRTYIFGVECSYDGGILTEEHYITPMYENLDVVAYRGVWVRNNAGFILGGLIVVAIIIIGLLVVFK